MDTEKMLALADSIESLEDGAFDMEQWWMQKSTNICGVAACVAGWAVLTDDAARLDFHKYKYLHPEMESEVYAFDFEKAGAKVLGLDRRQAYDLFLNTEAWKYWLYQLDVDDEVDCLEDITAKHASIVLRGLAEGKTEFPNWDDLEYDAYFAVIEMNEEAER